MLSELNHPPRRSLAEAAKNPTWMVTGILPLLTNKKETYSLAHRSDSGRSQV